MATIRLGNVAAWDQPPTRDEVLEAIKERDVLITDVVSAAVDRWRESLEGEGPGKEPFVIARGTPAIEGVDETFVWNASFEKQRRPGADEEPVDHYSFNSVITVDKDELIGTICPLQPARKGTDVRGNVLKPKHEPQKLQIGDTVRRVQQGEAEQVFANTAGRVVSKGGQLYIDEVLTIPGDVDFSTGHVNSSIDVKIAGTVRDRFEVRSAKSIFIGGAVETATVSARGDVEVRGGILTRHEGKIEAGGEIGAKFCNEAVLRATGDIKISKEVMNSKVHTEGRLRVERGAVIGGEIYARGGATIGTIGSDADVHTRICVGVHPSALAGAQKIDEETKTKLEAVEKIRATVQPLMANIKRLSAAQKEHATKLLHKADEAEAAIKEGQKRRERLLASAADGADAGIELHKIVHPGTTFQIGWRAAFIQKEIKGPVRIEERPVERVKEIVAVNLLTGSVQVLPSVHLTLEELREHFKQHQ